MVTSCDAMHRDVTVQFLPRTAVPAPIERGPDTALEGRDAIHDNTADKFPMPPTMRRRSESSW
jgi:hypothetical protein